GRDHELLRRFALGARRYRHARGISQSDGHDYRSARTYAGPPPDERGGGELEYVDAQRQCRQFDLVLHEGRVDRLAARYRDSRAHKESEEPRRRDALPDGELRQQGHWISGRRFLESGRDGGRLRLSRV